MSNSLIIDNYLHGTVGNFLENALTVGSDVSMVSAYFTIYAYQELKTKLDTIKRIRFLFGEPTFISNLDSEKINFRDFKIEDETQFIVLSNRLKQKSIARECANWLQEKAEIRSMVKPNFLHGKLYHIIQDNGVQTAIAGSSNFTVKGLGNGINNNIELNLIIDSNRERDELHKWFNDIWDNKSGLVEDVKDKVLKYLNTFYCENDPQFVYFKTLSHVFGQFLLEQEQEEIINAKTNFYNSQIWNVLYDFQKDGVKGAINKIQKHGGCIIADSVGLGKTFEALAVIKYFELRNYRVLVICPKKLSANWTIYQAQKNNSLNPLEKDRFQFSILWHTDIGRSGKSHADGIDLDTFNWGAYDLVVIDESHNFRANPVEKRSNNETTKLNRTKWLLDKIINSGVKTRVLMLSATPVNNSLRDLRNQITFITGGNDFMLQESCGIKSIKDTLERTQRHFTQWADSKNQKRHIKELIVTIDSAFFKLLDELTIARSRKHIKKFYNTETDISIKRFPERLQPKSIYSDIDIQNNFPSYEKIERDIQDYKLTIFNPTAYVKELFANLYEKREKNFTQKQRETVLVDMMKVNFLKRLESSIQSFAISIRRTVDKIQELENKIDLFFASNNLNTEVEWSTPEENISDEYSDEYFDEYFDKTLDWQVGKKLKFNFEHLDLKRWKEDLRRDRNALMGLLDNAKRITSEHDAKLHKLKEIICEKIKNPINEGNKKVLIFTAFTDTASYLYDNLYEWCWTELKLHCSLVCGTKTQTTLGPNYYDEILTNFSPHSKNRSKLNQQRGKELHQEIDILIATDCISEGQNLQDCDFLINYDIHWNPVRIIQRFGRIDRLGSTNEKIQLVNFWPTKDLDKYINLKGRIEARMTLVDLAATGEDNILNSEQKEKEEEELINAGLQYRNNQLKRLQNEVLDFEEIDDVISITDFTLNDFRMDLLNFQSENKKRLMDAPFGLYAVVPAPTGKFAYLDKEIESSDKELSVIKPGVIFCLVQKDISQDNKIVNPLNPFFLIYVYNDGRVQYNFTNAKNILEIFRKLCHNRTSPYSELCSLFNNETEQGTKMDKYSGLLNAVIGSIKELFGIRNVSSLKTNRQAVLIPETEQNIEINNFELITWLIIK
ncbi:MAG: phospholipase D-like domain-containing protein [Planctomycetaceae bacterium]|jgi:superfamily II DNA or RNA helicase|nr:phospholipase D-like domain-containing protein [Planctomycetaceae bacterium]